ncbi:BZ3500_MvSof-1268-A1-R1_Chr7-3g09573 [Microbotryum saponariae]|uniref:BZ3500_MvSof-1268-A1-R1_Chr7-3g09573 protein n=1 Tax=Microbotryum saponariae TaxID=289078 RepID=A0A2X0KUW8_9BASI|nr:BZ3501_MvSof-1269-A2-R1_Chr7-2g09296 [Microbotryum saponariae]SDA02226.1 BZ3500_MvSof-1268-A1-R1_Chr7-3g09573 [Microbotryum saponariae]
MGDTRSLLFRGHGIQLSVNPTFSRGPEGEARIPFSFVNAFERHYPFPYPPILPKRHQKVLSLPEQPICISNQVPPSNRSASCVMCLSEVPESLAHLAVATVGCPFARRLWSALSPAPHPDFVAFVSLSPPQLSSDPLEPITETALEELRASIQESKVALRLCNSPKGVLMGMIDFDSGSMSPTLLA